MARRILAVLGLLAFSSVAPLLAADNIVHLSVDATKPGPKIDRKLFGQFAENLGHGLYDVIWVGPDSSIPNTRGIRNDVVAALRELKVPNVRWPGGCSADQYHWRKGIGPRDKRPATVNSAWGDVIDTNAFGTDEFMDFIDQIGSTPDVSIDVGSGTPEEAAAWLEYMTAAAPTALAKGRAAAGATPGTSPRLEFLSCRAAVSAAISGPAIRQRSSSPNRLRASSSPARIRSGST